MKTRSATPLTWGAAVCAACLSAAAPAETCIVSGSPAASVPAASVPAVVAVAGAGGGAAAGAPEALSPFASRTRASAAGPAIAFSSREPSGHYIIIR